MAVPLRLADGEEAVVQATAGSSLEEVLRVCEAAAGVPAALLSLTVQGEARGAGALMAVRSRQHMPSMSVWPSPLVGMSQTKKRSTGGLACADSPLLRPGPPGRLPAEEPLASSLHSLAHSMSSRHHLKRQLADWSSFLLLPEGVRREMRGQGVGGWLQQHVWERLQGPRQAPPSTVWVSQGQGLMTAH